MPELPDLEVVKEFLGGVLPGSAIVQAEVRRPIVRDLLGSPPGAALAGREILNVGRWGKFLWLGLSGGVSLVINPKLAGRLALCEAGEPPGAHTALVLSLSSGKTLRYLDAKDMGQVYITPDRAAVPGLAAQGPDALDPSLSGDTFARRLRAFRGEIKNVLTTQEFVAGVGNAYADEILFRARLSPFRRRSRLSPEEVEGLYRAMRSVLEEAIGVLRGRVGSRIDIEVRDFLQVHGRGGQPCPRCGQAISELRARQRITSFCRRCQPGTLVRN